MLTQLRHYLEPPVFADEDKTRVANLLNAILWIFTVAAAVYSVALPFIAPDQTDRLLIVGIMLVLILGLRFLMRRGYIKSAGALLALSLWAVLTLAAITAGGVRAPGFHGYIIVILIAALLGSGRIGFGFAALCMLSGLIMLYAENANLLPPAITRTTTFLWAVEVIFFFVTALLLRFATGSIRHGFKQAQKAMHESEESFQLLFGNNPQPMYVFALNGLQFLAVNDTAIARYGYSRDEFLQMRASDIRPQKDVPRLTQTAAEPRTGLQHIGRWRHRLKDGQIIDVDLTVQTLEFAGQDAVLVLAQDITKRLRAEEALAREHNQLQTILETALDFIYVKDIEGRYLISNPAHIRSLGKSSSEDVIGKKNAEIHAPEVATEYDAEEKAIIETGQPVVSKEQARLDAAGKLIWLSTTKVPLRDSEGAIVGIVGITHDITEHKQAEARIQKLNEELEKRVVIRTEQLTSAIERLEVEAAARQKVVAALRGSEERLRRVIENMPVMMDAFDADGNVVVWNRECERVLGFSAEEIVDNPNAMELLHPDSAYRERMTAAWDGRGNDYRDWEWGMTHKDGSKRFVSWSNISDRFPISGWATWGIGVDVTERVQAKAALVESEERYRNIFEQTNDMIQSVTPDGGFDFVNSAWLETLGYTLEELPQLNLWDIIHPSEVEHCKTIFADVASGGPNKLIETCFVTKDGKPIDVEGNAVPRYVDGEVVATHSSFRDVTERKRARSELRESEARMHAAIESLPFTFWASDVDGVYTMQNASSIEAWGNMVGKSHKDVDLSADVRAEWDRNNRRALAGEVVQAETERVVSGEKTYGYRTVAPIRVGEEIRGLVGVTIDITERKQAEEALKEERAMLEQNVKERTAELSVVNSELAKAVRLKDEFLASMSHELRTPLNAILGLSETLREQFYGPLNEKQLGTLGTIEESGRHLLELITDILDLSRIEAGKLDLYIEDVPVQSVGRASLQFVKQEAHKKRLKVSTTYDSAAATVRADQRRLKQILINLLSNAVKFTPEGGSIGLEVLGDVQQQAIHFTVWDSGIGISAEDSQRLFKPFVQLDSSMARKYSGTGLGLSLAYRMTKMQGGSLTVESEVGRGSRFTISLPWHEPAKMLDAESSDSAQPQQPRATAQPRHSAAQKRLILIAEDNEQNLRTVMGYLEAVGYRLIVARDGVQAIRRAQEERPDVILMDIQMPEMDGLEAIRHIRADAELAGIPIIALTALAMPGDRERCLAAGANEYLSKPVNLKGLVDVIEAQLNAA